MTTLLSIKANPRPVDQSFTLTVSDAFIKAYKESHPDHEVIELDLYKENVAPLSAEVLGNIFTGQPNIAKEYAEQFAKADRFVFASPLWNFGIPAILKAYIDYVSYAGISFQYTSTGAEGLLANQGKKAIHINARGGTYSEPPMSEFEMGSKYLQLVLGFFGINDFQALSIEKTGSAHDDEAKKTIIDAHVAKAVELAKTF